MAGWSLAQIVATLFTVYTWLIIIRVLLTWLPLPSGGIVGQAVGLLSAVTDPYLDIFRRFIPTLGSGGMGVDISPIVAILVLQVLERVIVNMLL